VIVREKYFWPDAQLNLWTIIILAAAGTILGVFATFVEIQNRMDLNVPWLFPFGITVGALTIVLVIVQIILIAQRRLLPGFMILWSFILFVLYLTGVIGTAIQLFGPGHVSQNCNAVTSNPVSGASANTLIWLEQNSICASWYAAFSFWIVGDVFFIWMMIMAGQVSRNQYD
ncbi:hypothetical protein K402DRAFT_312548, partial [Aulographum hederae CBS 113979]